MVSMKQYKKLTPMQQGWVAYMESERPGSELKGITNLYPKDSFDYQQWQLGAERAVYEAQEGEAG